MKFMWRHLFSAIVLFCFIESYKHFPLVDNHSSKDNFVDILSEILQTSRAKDALLILRDSLLEKQTHNILDKISVAIIKRVSTLYVHADRREQKLQTPSSCNLVVYIYASKQEPNFIKSKVIAEDTRRFVHNCVRPKILILMILRQSSRNLTTLFQAMWSKKILDTIVVEYSRSKYSAEYSTIIHRYNPFNDSHTTESYSAHITWFTDNFPNMQGYPLGYAFIHRPPYSNLKLTLTGEEIKGVDKILSETLADKMNFTEVFKILPKDMPILDQMPNGTVYGIVSDVAAGKYDAFLTTLAIIGKEHSFGLHHQYVSPLLIENWCVVAPKLVKKDINSNSVIKLFFISFSIVGIFWLCSRLMKLHPNRWHPLKIIGMILATSLPPAPTTFRERLIYLSVLIVYACYSSILFIELTSTNLESNRYVQFNSFEDVINSDLVLMMHSTTFLIIRYNSDFEQQFRKYSEKILNVTHPDICLQDLLMYRNVSCLLPDSLAKLVKVKNMQNEESPYVKRISNIILMLVEGGLYNKWYRDYLQNETREPIFPQNGHKADSMYISIFDLIIYVLIMGYSISTFVFIVELIWKYLHINLNLC